MPSSRGSSWSRDFTWVSCLAGNFFTVWATEDLCEVSLRNANPIHEGSILMTQAARKGPTL